MPAWLAFGCPASDRAGKAEGLPHSASPGDPDLRRAVETVWSHLHLMQEPAPADLILCLGSHDIAVAVPAAALWQAGWAPRLALSGGIAHAGDLADPGWGVPAAEYSPRWPRRVACRARRC